MQSFCGIQYPNVLWALSLVALVSLDQIRSGTLLLSILTQPEDFDLFPKSLNDVCQATDLVA